MDTGSKIEVHLGASYRDKITHFEGVATAVTYYLGGNTRVVLEGPAGDTRNRAEGEYFDAFRLELLDNKVLDLTTPTRSVTHTDELIGSTTGGRA